MDRKTEVRKIVLNASKQYRNLKGLPINGKPNRYMLFAKWGLGIAITALILSIFNLILLFNLGVIL